MSYLNQPYKNNFQELCAAMPIFYLDVREMRAVLRAQGYLLDGLCDGMEKLVDVNFILTADDATIKLWEKALKITYKNRLTLDQRKRVVIGYIIGFGHIGEPEIRGIIGQYTPNDVAVSFWRGHIAIMIEGEVFDEENLLEALLRRIPAHLGLKITIHIRREFRQTIPVNIGGAVGSYFFFEPVVPEHITERTPVSVGNTGLISTYFDAQPLTPHETIRTSLDFAQGGAAMSVLDGGDTPDPKETVRTDLPLRHGGTINSEQDGTTTPEVHQTAHSPATIAQGAFARPQVSTDTPDPFRASTTRLPLLYGGTSTADQGEADTPDVQQGARDRVSLAQGALVRPQTATDTPKVKRAVTGVQTGAGGLYCHTHIKSKLIE